MLLDVASKENLYRTSGMPVSVGVESALDAATLVAAADEVADAIAELEEDMAVETAAISPVGPGHPSPGTMTS